MNEVKKTRKFGFVRARRLHPSKVLPKRDIAAEMVESIRREGIQQPIIVCPSPYEGGMYETIDGSQQREFIQDDQKVLVVVSYDTNDTEVFRISEATFKRKPRATYERSLFHSKWIKTIEADHGSRGAQSKIAMEANLSQVEMPHYLSINRRARATKPLLILNSVVN